MKKLLQLVLFLVLGTSLTYGQWTYVDDFWVGSQPHGLAVDPEGKIWIAQFAQTDTLSNGATASGITVLNPDGTEASFSPITHFTLNGQPDTLRFNNRGLALDHNGNILTCSGYVYRFNYQTGEAMGRFDYLNAVQALTEPATDGNGYSYITRVVPGGDPIITLDENLELYGFALDSNFVISRSLLASDDGLHLYHGGIYPAAGAIHYFGPDGPDGTFAVVDTILGPNPANELWGQILDWDLDGYLWIGSYWDTAPNAYKGWYKMDVNRANPSAYTNNVFLDSIGENLGAIPDPRPTPGPYYAAPRGVGFWDSGDGVYAYTADFDGGVVKRWLAGPTGIIEVDNGSALVKDFALEQNYPNPFNPSTNIPFALKKAAHVKLDVYNLRGQLVKTLVNEQMQPGSYEYEFDATGLATGTYFYRISFDGQFQTRQMMFTK